MEDEMEVMAARLPSKARVVLIAVGACLLASGATATFLTSNTIGSGTLIAVGAVFLFIGVIGAQIQRASFGGVDLDLAGIVEKSLDSPRPEVAEEVAAAVLDSRIPNDDPLRRRAEVLTATADYSDQVFQVMRRAGVEVQLVDAQKDQRFDALCRFNGVWFGVEIKYVRPRSNILLEQAIMRARILLADRVRQNISAVLVVVNTIAPARLTDGLEEQRVYLVTWANSADDIALQDAILRLAR